MRRKPAPITIATPTPAKAPESLYDRRARALSRALALFGTSIPTHEILASYLDDVLA